MRKMLSWKFTYIVDSNLLIALMVFTFSRIKLIYNLETCFNIFYDKYNHGPKSYYTSYIIYSVLAAKMHGNIMYTASTKLFPTPLMFKLYFSEITTVYRCSVSVIVQGRSMYATGLFSPGKWI